MKQRANLKKQLADDLSSAFCSHFCRDKCKATRLNDCCYCAEAGIVGAETIHSFISTGYMRKGESDNIKETGKPLPPL